MAELRLSCGLAEFSRRVLTLTAPGLGFAIRSRSESRGTLLVFGRAPRRAVVRASPLIASVDDLFINLLEMTSAC